MRCKWGWCRNNINQHNIFCRPSMKKYNISWAYMCDREDLLYHFECDIWKRDGKGRAIKLLNKDKYIYRQLDINQNGQFHQN